MDNNEIFLEFWKNFQWPEPKPLYFRLYHDEQGKPICYSREHREESYIDITPEQFALGDMNVMVEKGVLVKLSPPVPPKLKPSNTGTSCHRDDVTVIVKNGPSQTWSLGHEKD